MGFETGESIPKAAPFVLVDRRAGEGNGNGRADGMRPGEHKVVIGGRRRETKNIYLVTYGQAVAGRGLGERDHT